MSLTPRQSEILKAIIEEYIENAQPIGSVELVEARSLPISGATVRNIMSDLVHMGYLQMLHVSSGRVPSELAYRYYISDLMDESPITVLEEVSIRQKLWNDRYEIERLLQNVAQVISEVSDNLAFAMTDDGYYSYSGTSRILDKPEFYEIDVTKSVLHFVDDYELMKSVIDSHVSLNDVTVLIGREIGLANMEPVSIIATKAVLGKRVCSVGIIGPSRNNYCRTIPIMKHVKFLLSEIGQNL